MSNPINITIPLFSFSFGDIIQYEGKKYKVTDEYCKYELTNGQVEIHRYIYPYSKFSLTNLSNEGEFIAAHYCFQKL